MLKLLFSAIPAALVLAAVDSVATRLQLPHRPTSAALFVETVPVYFAACLLCLPLVALVTRERVQPERGQIRVWWLVALVGMAVVGHAAINRHTGLDANLAGLKSPRPWIEAGLSAAAVALAARVLFGLTSRRPAPWSAAEITISSIAIGLLLPPRFDSPRSADPDIEVAAGAAERPNLLLLIWDTARRPSFSMFGYERETTPELAALADSSRRYSRAHSVTHYTFTSHLSMLSGLLPSEHGARLLASSADEERTGPLLQQRLAEAGYRTGAFVGTGVLRSATGISRGFETYGDRVDPAVCDSYAWGLVHDLQSAAAKFVPALAKNGNPHWIEDFQRPANEVLGEATDWIGNGDPRPWFCMINLFDVHHPYTPDAEALEAWVAEYGGPMDGHAFRSDGYEKGYQPDDADDRHLLDLYDAEMWRLDQRVNDFLAQFDLDEQRIAVLMTSDHGEAFGEDDVYGHDDILEPQVSIPMLLRVPNDTSLAGDSDAPVSGVDVTPTLLGLAGLPPLESSTGLDLTQGDPPTDRFVWVEDRDFHEADKFKLAAYSGPYKIVRTDENGDETWELFDLRTDEHAISDVSAEHPELFRELVTYVRDVRPWWPDNSDGSAAEATGGASLQALQALGYLDGEPTFEDTEQDAPGPDPENAPSPDTSE